MPAYAQHRRMVRPRERAVALAAVVLVQAALGFALLTGLRVSVSRTADVVQRLIEVALPKPPPPPSPPVPVTKPKPVSRSSSAPKAEPKPLGGSLFTAPCDSQPYKASIDNLRSIGIATVVAAGNNGSTNALSSPGCRRDCAVGLSTRARPCWNRRPGERHVHGAGERPRHCLPCDAIQPCAAARRLDLPDYRAALPLPPEHRPLWPADGRRSGLGPRLDPAADTLVTFGDLALDRRRRRVMLV